MRRELGYLALMVVWVGLAGGLLSSRVEAADKPAESPSSDSPLAAYTEQTYTDAEGVQHRYRLSFPAGYRSDATTQYPLVLLLHGAGERGDDNAAQLVHGATEFASAERQAEYPCFVLVPQVPSGEKWVDVDWGDSGGVGTFPETASPAFAAAVGMIKTWIDAGRVDPSRIYVTGLSMGGYGTWYAGAQAKELFAAIAPICGGGDPGWADRYQGLPIWAFHGSDDRAVPVARSREMIKALQDADHEPVALYTEYEGGPHNVWTRTFARDDFFAWLFKQQRTKRSEP